MCVPKESIVNQKHILLPVDQTPDVSMTFSPNIQGESKSGRGSPDHVSYTTPQFLFYSSIQSFVC